MPKKRREKRARAQRNEIVVSAPFFRSEKDALLKDTTAVEALEVFRVSGRIGRRLSGLMITVGILLSLFSIVNILVSIEFTFSSRLFVFALGFFGAINIFCGLMLLAKR